MSERAVLPPRMERRLGIAERMRHDNEWAHSYWTDVRDLERRLIEAERAVQDDGLDVERVAKVLHSMFYANRDMTDEDRANATMFVNRYRAAPPLHDRSEAAPHPTDDR